MGDGAVVSNCDQRPVLNDLSSWLLQARRVFEAEPGFCKVDAQISRDLEGETMPNLSLRLYKQPPRLLPAVFGVTLLCLPLGYARLRLHVKTVGATRRGRERRRLTMGRV
jgi:hypothetical protein